MEDNVVDIAAYRNRILIAADDGNLYSMRPEYVVIQGYSYEHAALLLIDMLRNGVRIDEGVKVRLEVVPLPPPPEPAPYEPQVIEGGAQRTWWTRVLDMFRRKPRGI